MSIFEYLMVLLSVVLSLGLVLILNGLANLFHNRQKVRWSAVYLLWIVEVLILHFDFWQYTWDQNSSTSFAQADVILMFLMVSLIYLSASTLMLATREGETFDLPTSWQSVRREFLAIYLAYLALILVLNLSSYGEWQPMLWNIGLYVMPFILLAALAFFVSNRHVQLIAIVGILSIDIGRYILVQPTIG